MVDTSDRPGAHPAIAAMVAREGAQRVVTLTGFIGPSDGGMLRLYPSMNLARCLDIPEEAVVHVEEPAEAGGRVWAHVDSRAEITVSLRASRTVPVEELLGSSPPGGGPEPAARVRDRGGVFPPLGSCDLKCAEEYLDCLVMDSPRYCEQRQYWCRLMCGSPTLPNVPA